MFLASKKSSAKFVVSISVHIFSWGISSCCNRPTVGHYLFYPFKIPRCVCLKTSGIPRIPDVQNHFFCSRDLMARINSGFSRFWAACGQALSYQLVGNANCRKLLKCMKMLHSCNLPIQTSYPNLHPLLPRSGKNSHLLA